MSRTGTRQEPTPSDDGEGKKRRPLLPGFQPRADGELVDGGPFPVGATSIADFPDVGENGLAPTFGRAMARLTDFVLSVLLPSSVVYLAFGTTTETESGEEVAGIPVWTLPLLVGILAAYEIGSVAWKGATPGMLIGRLTVKSLDSGEDPTVKVAIRRAIVPLVAYALSLVIPPLVFAYIVIYVTAVFDRKLRQGWHDKFAGTVVVRTR